MFLTQEEPLRPLKFGPTLLLYLTVIFGLIDVKQTQKGSCVHQLSTEKTDQIYHKLNHKLKNFTILLVQKKFFCGPNF